MRRHLKVAKFISATCTGMAMNERVRLRKGIGKIGQRKPAFPDQPTCCRTLVCFNINYVELLLHANEVRKHGFLGFFSQSEPLFSSIGNHASISR